MAGLDIVQDIADYRRHVQREWGVEIDVRVGINTGLVVVGAVGSDLRMEYSALGDAINLAARMEQTAQPGTVQIAEPTYRLVSALFDVEALGVSRSRARTNLCPPTRCWRPKWNLAACADPGLESPLVGRDAEFEILRRALDELEQGHGGILSLVAEAGLGKSRLVAEARQLAPILVARVVNGLKAVPSPMRPTRRMPPSSTSSPPALTFNKTKHQTEVPRP